MQEETDVLLDKSEPVIIREPARWWQKMMGKKENVYTIELKPLPYGVVLQITRCLAQIELPDFSSISVMAKFFVQNEIHITKAIAYALKCDPDKEPGAQTIQLIRKRMDTVKAAEVFYFVIEQTNLINFTTAISWVTRKLVAEKSTAKPKSSE